MKKWVKWELLGTFILGSQADLRNQGIATGNRFFLNFDSFPVRYRRVFTMAALRFCCADFSCFSRSFSTCFSPFRRDVERKKRNHKFSKIFPLLKINFNSIIPNNVILYTRIFKIISIWLGIQQAPQLRYHLIKIDIL